MTAQRTWRTVGVSSQGTSHLKTGDPCQDAHDFRVLSCGTLVVAVADGAGTARLAEIGASLAVKTVLESVCSELEVTTGARTDAEWQALLTNAVTGSLRILEEEATARDAALRDFACTLAIAVVRPGEQVAALQIGDGAVVAQEEDGEVFVVTRPAPSEYLNETTFLVSPGAVDGASFVVRHGDIARLAALTDGLQMLALRMPDGDPHPGFFDPLFRFVAAEKDPESAKVSLQAFLNSSRVRERADDDLTLFLAACNP